jgi:hypothetical protein
MGTSMRRIANVGALLALLVTATNLEARQQPQADTKQYEGAGRQTLPNNVATPPTSPQQTSPQDNTNPRRPNPYLDWGVNHVIAALTFVLAMLALFQWRTHIDMLETSRVVERGYVDISHDSPGLQIGPDNVRISFSVKNHGRTPASVSGLEMLLVLEETNTLPAVPPYGSPPSKPPMAFLMPGERYHKWENRPGFPQEVWTLLAAGERHMWAIGFVDYIDKFGARHRSGYARKFISPPLPGSSNNLVFISNPGYNYDIEIDEHGQPRKQDG